MKRLTLLAPLLLCLTVSLASGLSAASVPGTRQALQRLYNLRDAAMAHKDAVGSYAFRTPDFIGTDEKGRHETTAQQIADARGTFAIVGQIKTSTTIEKFVLNGPTEATVTVLGRISGIALQTKSHARLVVDQTSRDVWVKTPQGWRQKSTQDLFNKTTIDGKPISIP